MKHSKKTPVKPKKTQKAKVIRGGASVIVVNKTVEKADKALLMTKHAKMKIYQEICDKMVTLGALSKDLVNPSKERRGISVDSILNGVITVISEDPSQREYYYKVITDMFSSEPGSPKEVQDMDKKSVISSVISDWIVIHKNYCAKFKE